jgi:hypothetical protein
VVLARRLADRSKLRSEATIQADVRQLLLSAGLNLGEHELDVQLETQVGDRRRIDVEVGYTVIEVKKDLRSEAVAGPARVQLAGYVATRELQTGQRYLGVLTDGALWRVYQMRGGTLVESTRHEIHPTRPDVQALRYWLEGILATTTGVPPVPAEVTARLGATSASYAVDRATLGALYAAHRDEPTVALKRELWASLLRSALGTQFTDDDELFLEHTLLVNTAEVIAHLVLGLDVTDLQPATLLSGQRFEAAGIHGVVEPDFFDWVIEVPGGAGFIRTLARRLARFAWAHVEHDVLKVLYESVIGTETRKALGEYYTPDWLADRVVDEAVTDPLHQRVLDPSCGSGTFLFHAVRRYLTAADSAGVPISVALGGLADKVIGMDLHPVAVSLARVTYLLAIGRDRLIDPARRSITVPVYLGDSLQWQQNLDLFTEGHLVIPTGSGDQLFDAELRWPDHLLDDAARFDRIVTALADQAAKPRTPGQRPVLPAGLVQRLAIAPVDLPVLEENYALLCRLHDEGRDHIWGYYVRNLARPVWLSRPGHRVDVLVGNPPWLSYRHMPPDMQATFRAMSTERGLWAGAEVATHQDLSGLFVARTVQQYLRAGGAFAFVMPNAALDRKYFAGFRTGHYPDPAETTNVAFTGSWDLRRLRPHFFPRGAAVTFGTRTTSSPVPLPARTERWTGRLPRGADTWAATQPTVHREAADLTTQATDAGTASPYGPRFAAGATIFPKVLCFVDTTKAGPLGLVAGRQAVRSSTSSTEKPPWKHLPRLEGVVEAEFVRPVLLGESLLPYRMLPPRTAVLPLEGAQLLDRDHPHLDLYPGLADWWRQAEDIWLAHRSSDKLTLTQRLDFRKGLTQQLPVPPLRLVYGASGMHVTAALVDDRTAVTEHKLYWATITTAEEGHYLCAILNSPALTDLVRPLMSYGKDERDIDKHLWRLPIPAYDPGEPDHQRLAALGADCATLVAALDLDETGNFITLRRRARAALATSSTGQAVDQHVRELLG